MKPAFIVGAPRSGTSWFQQLVGAHPEIVTPPETHLMHMYLHPMLRAWQRQVGRMERAIADLDAGRSVGDRLLGLPSVLTERQFRDGVLALIDEVVDQARTSKPEADVFLEKTPSNALSIDVTEWFFTEPKYIHLIRHPRDSIASLMRLSRTSWGYWTPQSVDAATRYWSRYHHGSMRTHEFEGRSLVIRYEDLVDDAAASLESTFEFLGVQADRLLCDSIAADLTMERQRDESANSFVFAGELKRMLGERPFAEPGSHFRENGSAHALTPRDEWLIDRALGDIIRELGYAPARNARSGWLESAALEVTYRARSAARRVAGSATQRATAYSARH